MPKAGLFLATNDLGNRECYSDEQMLCEYKEQQSVERGFRFLKDPLVSCLTQFFLKLPKRH